MGARLVPLRASPSFVPPESFRDNRSPGGQPETCILVGLALRARPAVSRARSGSASGYTPAESMEELAGLARGAGAEVLDSVIQVRDRIHPATLIGSGKVSELRAWADQLGADLVLFDHDLTPTQQRNLESALERRVLDRTQLILDIFARHARTREGRLQVELAQLSYLLPRLTGRGVELSRLGGGIGTRGPGETKLESDRRRIARRMGKLKADLESVRSTRRLQRRKRTAVPLLTIALVGYTNAGKSTLFNALTSGGAVADSRMFATLDPTIRALELPSKRRVLLSDTVGFIRNLPPTLVQAFRATLEEVTEAAMILHVVDVSSEHHREQAGEVLRILQELRAHNKPQILTLNKTDLLSQTAAGVKAALPGETAGADEVVAISARRRRGMNELIAAIERRLPVETLSVQRYHFDHNQGDKLSFLYQHARVLERKDVASGVEIVAEVSEGLRSRLGAFSKPSGGE